jgi:hypothetical protein
MTDAEIAGYMNWRGPGAYTQHQMKRIKALLVEAESREREVCARITEASPDRYHAAAAIRARGQA